MEHSGSGYSLEQYTLCLKKVINSTDKLVILDTVIFGIIISKSLHAKRFFKLLLVYLLNFTFISRCRVYITDDITVVLNVKGRNPLGELVANPGWQPRFLTSLQLLGVAN